MAPKRKPAAVAVAVASEGSAEAEEIPEQKSAKNNSKRSRNGAGAVKGKAGSRAKASAPAKAAAASEPEQSEAESEHERPEKPTELADHTDYFLVKDEPSDYSIDDFLKETNRTTCWDGVRNFQARNIMQKMRKGNQVLFYRSGTHDPGVVGLCEVARDPYPDHTSWDENSKAYDPKSSADNPRWFMVDLRFKEKFEHPVSLQTLKEYRDEELEGLALLRIGRLSVMPLTKQHFDFILKLTNEEE